MCRAGDSTADFIDQPQPSQINCKAYIDGRDVVKVSGNKLWFEHKTYELPGRTIYVNGKAWTPDWTNNVSTEFMGLTPAFRPANAHDIQITKRAGRQDCQHRAISFTRQRGNPGGQVG